MYEVIIMVTLFTINNLVFINSLLQEAIADHESRLYSSLKLYLMEMLVEASCSLLN